MVAAAQAENVSHPVPCKQGPDQSSRRSPRGSHPNIAAAGLRSRNTKQWRKALDIARIELAHANVEVGILRRGSELHARAKQYHGAIKAGCEFRLSRDTTSILRNDRILREFLRSS